MYVSNMSLTGTYSLIFAKFFAILYPKEVDTMAKVSTNINLDPVEKEGAA